MFETLFSRPLPSNVTTPARLPMNARHTSHSLPLKARPVPLCAYGRTTACVLPGSLSTGRRTTLSPQLTSRPWRLPGPRRAWRAGGQRHRKTPQHMFRIAAVAFLRSLGRLCLAPSRPPGVLCRSDCGVHRGSAPQPVAIGRDLSQWALEGRQLFVLPGGPRLRTRQYRRGPCGRVLPAHGPPVEPDVTPHCGHGAPRLVPILRSPRLDEARLGRGYPCAPPLPARKPPAWADLGPSQPYG